MNEDKLLIQALKELLFDSMHVHALDVATSEVTDADVQRWVDSAIEKKLRKLKEKEHASEPTRQAG